MKTEALAGPQVYKDGSKNTIRQDRLGAAVITKFHGKYSEQTARGNVYCATSAAGGIQTNSATSPSHVPISLQNPTGSKKNLYLLRTHLLPTVTNGTVVTGAFAYYGVSSASFSGLSFATINPTFIGAAAVNKSVALCPASGVVSNATDAYLIMPFATKFGTVAISQTTGLPQRLIDDVDGQIVIPPGCILFLHQTIADSPNITAIVAFVWEEVPV